jgi:hypothetical protein
MSADLALRVYAQAMRPTAENREELGAAVVAGEQARKDTKSDLAPIEDAPPRAA